MKIEDDASVMCQPDPNAAIVASKSQCVPPSPQPFLFRQYTLREFITPTKQGNVAMKEVSYTCSANNWSPSFSEKSKMKPLSLDFSFSSKMLQTENKNSGLLMLPDSSPKDSPCINSKNRIKHNPPIKKAKTDLPLQRRSSRYNGATERRNRSRKTGNVKELDWKAISIISFVPVLLLAGIAYSSFFHSDSDTTQEGWDTKHLSEALKANVFGQEDAVRNILSIMDDFFNKNQRKESQIILITGSSGVGKSLVSSIIRSNFPTTGTSELVLDPLPQPEVVIRKLSNYGPNLIVVDSLSHNKLNETVTWVKNVFNEGLWENKFLLLVLIFNVEIWNGNYNTQLDNSWSNYLKRNGEDLYFKLKQFGLTAKHVHFDHLTKEHIKECIKVELVKRGMEGENVMERYIEIISNDVDHLREGCKRIATRLQYLLRG